MRNAKHAESAGVFEKEGVQVHGWKQWIAECQERTYQCASDYCHILFEKLSNSNPGVWWIEELWNYQELTDFFLLNFISAAAHDYKLW